MKISEEQKNMNYTLWLTKLQENGVDTSILARVYGEKIKNATYGKNNSAAFSGAMLHVVIRKICRIAININKCLSESVRVDPKSIIKVCLLQHISKAVMLVETIGYNGAVKYEFNDDKEENYVLKGGERSALMCMQNGIPLTNAEFEAMTSVDKEFNTKNDGYANMLTLIVSSANRLANAEIRDEDQKFKR